jgi:hypothetical protein
MILEHTSVYHAYVRTALISAGRSGGSRVIRWLSRIGGAAIVMGVFLGLLWIVASRMTEVSFWSRILVWQNATFQDFETKFPARPIPNGPTSFAFRPAPAEVPSYLATVTYRAGGRALGWPTETLLPLDLAKVGGHPVTVGLDEFLASTGTTAFLIVKGDALLYEGYFNGAQRSSMQTSFSVAKCVVSALVGTAIADVRRPLPAMVHPSRSATERPCPTIERSTCTSRARASRSRARSTCPMVLIGIPRSCGCTALVRQPG